MRAADAHLGVLLIREDGEVDDDLACAPRTVILALQAAEYDAFAKDMERVVSQIEEVRFLIPRLDKLELRDGAQECRERLEDLEDELAKQWRDAYGMASDAAYDLLDERGVAAALALKSESYQYA